MMPNIPLHSMIESNWIVPRDENQESSLFLLEQQEKEYNASLADVANVAAPEPIGTQRHSSSLASSHLGVGVGSGMGMNMTMDSSSHGMMRRIAPPSTSRRSRSSRSRSGVGSTTRVSPRRTDGRGTAAARSERTSSRAERSHRSNDDGRYNLPVPTSPITPPPRTYSGISGMRSESSEEIQANHSPGMHMDA